MLCELHRQRRGWECMCAGLPSTKTPATRSANVPASISWMPLCIAGMPDDDAIRQLLGTKARDDERRDDNKGHPLFDRRSPDARNHS